MSRYFADLLHDIGAAWREFRYLRLHLRRGGNPDNRPAEF